MIEDKATFQDIDIGASFQVRILDELFCLTLKYWIFFCFNDRISLVTYWSLFLARKILIDTRLDHQRFIRMKGDIQIDKSKLPYFKECDNPDSKNLTLLGILVVLSFALAFPKLCNSLLSFKTLYCCWLQEVFVFYRLQR